MEARLEKRLDETQDAPVALQLTPPATELLEDSVVIDLREDPPLLSIGDKTLTLNPSRPSLRQRAIVRSLDLLVAIPIAILALPFMVMIGALVGVTSRGPVLYRSTRQTRNGETFGMIKFRTMVADADEVLAQYLDDDPDARELFERHNKFQKDPRVTRVGRVLRGWSLDELPQFFNVINGEMSIVGPRPRLDWESTRFGVTLPTVERVKGGLTGQWQVNGRSDVTFEERLVMDVDYAIHRRLKSDLKILVKTARQFLQGSPGAY